MTQPIDVAYVDIVSNSKDFRKTLSKDMDLAVTDIEKKTQTVADKVEQTFKRAGESARGAFTDSEGRLTAIFDTVEGAGKEAAKALGNVGEAAGGAARGAQQVLNAFGNVSNVIGQLGASGPIGIGILAAAFLALGAAAAAAAAIINNLIIIAGAGLAALPGLVVAAAAGFGILAVALNGVMEAFGELTEESSSGARSIARDERAIAGAQRNVILAQRELNDARKEAAERISDLRIELARAAVDELRSTKNLDDARRALANARAFGSSADIREAEVRLKEAEQALVEAKEKTQDLKEENTDAAEKGVNNADNVVQAQERLLDAQDALAASQERVSAGAAKQRQAFDALTPSAQAFVKALVSAKEQLGPVADAIQEAFFSGTAPLIQPIVDNIKELQPALTRVASGFGKIFKEILKFLGGDVAKNAIESILNGLADFLEAVSPAVVPLLEAFAGLAGQSGEFGKNLGELVATGLTKLADFVKNVDLKQVFADAKTAINELLPLIRPLLSITIDLFKILVDAGKIILPPLALVLNAVAVAANLAANSFQFMINIARPAFEWLRVNGLKAIKVVADAISNLPTTITNLGTRFLNAGKSIITSLMNGLGTAGGFVSNFAKNLGNGVIRFINNNVLDPINRGIQRIEDGLNSLPFFDGINLPNISRIPQLAKGGLLTEDAIFRGGEGGRDEAVIPLEDPAVMAKIGKAIAGAGSQNGAGGIVFSEGAVQVNFQGAVPTQSQARETGLAVGQGIMDVLARRGVRMQVRTI